MEDKDAFQLNIMGAENLVNSNANKVMLSNLNGEGVTGEEEDELDLKMDDSELIELATKWENDYAPYQGKIEVRQKLNRKYLKGTQNEGSKTSASNLLFEATATFVPQALAKNPEPVVFSDNTTEGKEASNDIKTMLQFHSDILCLRKKLGVMVWHWGIYFTAVVKHGWDKATNDIKTEIRKPSNMLFDPNGYVDEFGDFCGWTGERISGYSAKEAIEYFPKKADFIKSKVNGKLGTTITYTEWWNDDYTFTTFAGEILDKSKNPYFNYEEGKTNHFGKAKKPYTFLSVFSLQEEPHDFTNLIEQNIANQDDIVDEDKQVGKNLRHGNNSIVCDPKYFTSETAHQAADALEKGDPILGDPQGIKRMPANSLPPGLLDAIQIKKDTLRGIYGTQGLSAQRPDENTTARGMILNKSHDSTRIGGGIGDALEQVADNIFNWWTQLYYVFYDEAHYGAIMGQAHAVEFTKLMMTNQNRHFVVSVSPNSMQPKDELTEMNQAIDLWNKKGLDPISLFKKLNFPDPMETAKQVALWNINPQGYMQQMFPEAAPQPMESANPGNPVDINKQPVPGQDMGLSNEPASAALSQVPL